MVTMMLAMWQLGQITESSRIVRDAAREAARVAAGGTNNGTTVTVANVQTAVQNFLTAAGMPSTAVNGAVITVTDLASDSWTNPGSCAATGPVQCDRDHSRLVRPSTVCSCTWDPTSAASRSCRRRSNGFRPTTPKSPSTPRCLTRTHARNFCCGHADPHAKSKHAAARARGPGAGGSRARVADRAAVHHGTVRVWPLLPHDPYLQQRRCRGAAYACKHTSPIVISGTTYGDGASDVTNVVNSCLGSQQLANPAVSVYLSDALGNPVADSAGNNPGLFTNAGVGQYVCVQLTGTYSFMPTKFLGLPSTMVQTFTTVRRSEAN